ncbi:proline dehydrogenase family protein [Bacillus weihaiensis]|uniref:proline dehydrogenase n=1 Tax=Bacillus weihaiensis TaxID=1547283 RepID=A0A1L3MN44_9BACI|nr:proline dehydrogenase family protein [Bacillus weihaiensis]APH03768.1 proline dehydrogenase [Bacillus weihaiensis]
MDRIVRNSFMFLSRNKFMTNFANKYGHKLGASRFVAGETIEEAVKVIRGLNEKGLEVTLDHLGEFIHNEKEAINKTNQCIDSIYEIGKEGVHSQISVKLTSLGLDISDEVVVENMRRILREAEICDVFVTIDMEDHSRCEKTLTIFKKLKEEFPHHVGTVLQAYLYRSVYDIDDLNPYQAPLRLVKGAYKESAKVAFPDKAEVDENFKHIIMMHMINGNFTAVATHDDHIIDFTKQIVNQYQIPREQYEFQMLYGIRPEKQLQLVKEGYQVRIYVPYGTDWYGYFMRRMAERPANVSFVVKGMFRK